jgi:hypothetical protein
MSGNNLMYDPRVVSQMNRSVIPIMEIQKVEKHVSRNMQCGIEIGSILEICRSSQ